MDNERVLTEKEMDALRVICVKCGLVFYRSDKTKPSDEPCPNCGNKKSFVKDNRED